MAPDPHFGKAIMKWITTSTIQPIYTCRDYSPSRFNRIYTFLLFRRPSPEYLKELSLAFN